MFDVSAIRKAFSRASAGYDAHSELQKIVRDDALRLACGCWPEDAHILDAGSGTGGFAHSAALLGMRWRITAMDIAFGMCIASHAVNASADAMPFADEAFDGVFSSLMLQWATDPLAALREMTRVTRPGGRVVIATFTDGTLHELRDAFAAVDSAPHVSDFIAPMQLTALTAHVGFRLLHAQEENFAAEHADLRSLMRSLKSIGAGNKLSARSRGLMTPRKLAAVEAHYRRHFGSNKSLPATWNVMTLMMEKPA